MSRLISSMRILIGSLIMIALISGNVIAAEPQAPNGQDAVSAISSADLSQMGASEWKLIDHSVNPLTGDSTDTYQVASASSSTSFKKLATQGRTIYRDHHLRHHPARYNNLTSHQKRAVRAFIKPVTAKVAHQASCDPRNHMCPSSTIRPDAVGDYCYSSTIEYTTHEFFGYHVLDFTMHVELCQGSGLFTSVDFSAAGGTHYPFWSYNAADSDKTKTNGGGVGFGIYSVYEMGSFHECIVGGKYGIICVADAYPWMHLEFRTPEQALADGHNLYEQEYGGF